MLDLLIEKISPFPVDITVDLIVAEAEKQGWRVPVVHDLQQTLAKSGKEVLPVRVIELCNPELAGKLLEMNHERIISVFMPCRISVYQKSGGTNYVAVMDAASFVSLLPESIAPVMIEASEGSLKIIDSALHPGS